VVIGSAAVDVVSQANVTSDADGSRGRQSTSPGTVDLSLGGVGRNIAEAAHRISTSRFQAQPSATVLVSSVGDDPLGRLLLEEMGRIGVRTDGVMTTRQRSAVCNMVLDSSRNLIGGVADMDITRSMQPEMVWRYNCVQKDGKPITTMHRSSLRSSNMTQLLSQWTPTFHLMY
jgi:pseudouridine-5'-phosphate glycosidase/pseudouridine kinase